MSRPDTVPDIEKFTLNDVVPLFWLASLVYPFNVIVLPSLIISIQNVETCPCPVATLVCVVPS